MTLFYVIVSNVVTSQVWNISNACDNNIPKVNHHNFTTNLEFYTTKHTHKNHYMCICQIQCEWYKSLVIATY